MYNGNQITAEIRLVRDPERSDRADVVKAGGQIFQGKKEQNKEPIWLDVAGWGFQGRSLETLAKGDVIVVSGSWSVDYWENNGEKKQKNVITADTISKKVWPPQQQQNNQQPQQPQNYNSQPQQPYGNQPQNQGYNQQNNQQGYGGGYQQPTNEEPIPF